MIAARRFMVMAVVCAPLVIAGQEGWPTYHGDHSGRHHSALDQITIANVKSLSLAWVHRVSTSIEGAILEAPGITPPPSGNNVSGRGLDVKAIPLMVGGVLYFSTPNHAYAVDARTGHTIWHYVWKGRGAIGHRGMGIHGDWLYLVTADNRLVSLEAATGQQRWSKALAPEAATNFSTSAPVIVRNHVLVGVGGDSGTTQGWIEARDPETGEQQWKWISTPRKGEPGSDTWPNEDVASRGAGAPWQPPTYDPELNLLYVTTGQPTPTFNGKSRPGANLYTCSVVALNPDTGRMAWHYQFSPHDTHDWDSTQVPVIFEGMFDGQPRKLLAQANRNGYFFVLDRTTGKSLVVTRFLETANRYKGLDANGVLVPDEAKEPSPGGTLVFPDSDGAANYPAPSFSPQTGLFYVNATNAASIFYLPPDSSDPTGFGRGSEHHTGLFESSLLAIDYRTGKINWAHKYPQTGFWSSTHPGILTTASGLLFTGDPSGNFIAYDARDGQMLWHASLGAPITNSPQTYLLDGRQYVVIAAGDTLFAFHLQTRAESEFTSMFDGRTLSGWHWSRTSHHGTTAEAIIEDGALVLRQRPFGQGGLLLSDKTYTDFELSLEAKPDPDFNSGIFLRSSEGGSAYQIELVRPGNTGAWLGEMMRLGQPEYIGARADINTVWKDGEWNTMRVRMVGEAPHVTLWINDVKMWELQMPKNDQIGGLYGGRIGLQLHWTATFTNAAGVPYGSGAPWAVQRFRNIRIKELK